MRKIAIFVAALGLTLMGVAPVVAAQPTAQTPPASLFTASSDIFNQAVTSWPVDPESANMVAGLVKSYQEDYGTVGIGGIPIIYAPPNTPTVTVTLQTSGCGGGGGGLNGATSAPIPSYLGPIWANNGSSDNPLVVYDPSTGWEGEYWQARYNTVAPDGWSACYGGYLSMGTSDGVLPNGGLSATRIAYGATAITENDVNSGAIDHAMAIQVPNCDGGVYPATDHDCQGSPCNWATATSSCYLSEGSYFRFAASVNCASYDNTPLEEMVCVAGQKYGFVVTDFAGDVQVASEDVYDWVDNGNVGNGPVWGDNANGQCCVIITPGQDPISRAETKSNGQEDLYTLTGEPWSTAQVVDPPGYNPPNTVSGTCGQIDGYPIETLTWNADGMASAITYVGEGDQYGYSAWVPNVTSPYPMEYSNGNVSITVNGITTPTFYADCGG